MMKLNQFLLEQQRREWLLMILLNLMVGTFFLNLKNKIGLGLGLIGLCLDLISVKFALEKLTNSNVENLVMVSSGPILSGIELFD